MRFNTTVWIGIRNVGLKGEGGILIQEATLAAGILAVSKFLADSYMATRFDICIARSKEAVEHKLGVSPDRKTPDFDSLNEFVDKMLQESGDAES